MEEHPTVYWCDWRKHGKCGNSPFCTGNDPGYGLTGGDFCEGTTDLEYAWRDESGEPIVLYKGDEHED